MILNDAVSASDLCGKCKNVDICKYALTDSEALDGLKVGDGTGPFVVFVDCKYRDVRPYSNTRALNPAVSNLAANYGE